MLPDVQVALTSLYTRFVRCGKLAIPRWVDRTGSQPEGRWYEAEVGEDTAISVTRCEDVASNAEEKKKGLLDEQSHSKAPRWKLKVEFTKLPTYVMERMTAGLVAGAEARGVVVYLPSESTLPIMRLHHCHFESKGRAPRGCGHTRYSILLVCVSGRARQWSFGRC